MVGSKVGMSHGHLDVGVLQQVIHGPQVGPDRHQPTGKGATLVVPGEIFESSFAGRIFKPMSGAVHRFPMIPADKNWVTSFRLQVQLPKCKERLHC
jgi:hypothetical protein